MCVNEQRLNAETRNRISQHWYTITEILMDLQFHGVSGPMTMEEVLWSSDEVMGKN